MTRTRRRTGPQPAASGGSESTPLITTAHADLLGAFPQMVTTAALSGARPDSSGLRAVTELGRQAAERGVAARAVVTLYLSAAAQLWTNLPEEKRSRNPRAVHAAAASVLAVTSDAIGALVSGHQAARQQMIRHELTTRQEFIDDLLRGDADVARMVERAEPFGLDLGAAHHVVLAAPAGRHRDVDRAALAAERRIVDTFGDRDVLVGTKDGRMVIVVPGRVQPAPEATEATLEVSRLVNARLHARASAPGSWRVAAGRAFIGSFGIARSYEEARETLELAHRLGLETFTLSPGQLLVHRVIGRDQAAIVDLVRTVLGPLEQARGGAEPLLDTLAAYFECSETATEAATRLHVSVRTVTYRLDRIARLTGYHPARPDQRFVLQTAVQGARLLDWPARSVVEGG